MGNIAPQQKLISDIKVGNFSDSEQSIKDMLVVTEDSPPHLNELNEASVPTALGTTSMDTEKLAANR
jgi:hypothetical protein